MKKEVLLIVLLFLLPALGFADSGGTATIKGTVKDASSAEPLPGATVMIQETTLGGASDLDGNYTIRHVPAGSFTVKFSAVGYKGTQKRIEVKENEVVELNINLNQGSIMGSEVIVSASRYEQNKAEIPITTSVVSAKDIEAQPVRQLDQVLETVPGVDMVRSGGYGSSTVQIRGSNTYSGGGLGTRVLMLYDGFPLNAPDAGSLYWSMLSMNSIERIEIVKGNTSSLYGAGAMGGTISAIAALPNEFTFKARFQNGFYDTPPKNEINTSVYPGGKSLYFYSTELEHGNKIGDLRYNLVYAHTNDDGYRQSAQMNSNDIKIKARYDLSSTQYLQLTSMLAYVSGGIPYPWNTGDKYNALTSSNPNYYMNDDIKDNSMQMIGLTHMITLSNTASLETKLYLNRSYWVIKYYPERSSLYNVVDNQGHVVDNYQTYLAGNRRPYNPNDPSTYNDSDARRYGGSTQLNFFLGSHRIVTGAEYRYDDVISTMYHNNTAYGAGIFAQDDYQVTDKLRLNFGARFDIDHVNRSSVTYTDYIVSTTAQNTVDVKYQTLSQFSPRIAATYMFDPETSLRASVGRSMRAPTLGERFVTQAGFFNGIPNGDLKAERMTSTEIGVFKSFSRYLAMDVSAYWNQYDDLIESQNVKPNPDPNDPGSIVFQFRNISKARILGLEVSLSSQPIDELALQVGYNYMNAKDLTSGEDRRLGGNNNPADGQDWLSYRPEHNFTFSASFMYSGLFLNYSGRYVSKIKSVRIYANPSGIDYPGDFFVMNFAAKYEIYKGLNLTGAVRNIGNVQYAELEHYISAGRSFHFGFEYAY